MTPLVALTIAGSDSGGGAGLQADCKTFAALGIHGVTAVTAVTAQNTVRVDEVVLMSPSFVVQQIETVMDDLPIAAVKTGMLGTPQVVAAVASLAQRGALPQLVVDPVLVSSSGDTLMASGGVEAYREVLLPHAAVITPNLWETAMLTGRDPDGLGSIEAMTEAALELKALGARVVVVKGGHLGHGGTRDRRTATGSPDVVASDGGTYVLASKRIATRNDHGTGCSLSAAIAAHLARGTAPVVAVEEAQAFVHRALLGARGWELGSGHGPIDHFGWDDRSR